MLSIIEQTSASMPNGSKIINFSRSNKQKIQVTLRLDRNTRAHTRFVLSLDVIQLFLNIVAPDREGLLILKIWLSFEELAFAIHLQSRKEGRSWFGVESGRHCFSNGSRLIDEEVKEVCLLIFQDEIFHTFFLFTPLFI